jgi:hypothetical protein
MKRVCFICIAFTFFVSTAFSGNNNQWVFIMTKPTKTYAQTWRIYSKPDIRKFNAKYKAGYFVTSITYDNNRWLYTYSKCPGFQQQHLEILPVLSQKKIETYLKKGYSITEAEFGNNEWNIVFSRYKPYKEQKVLIRKEYPESEIKNYSDKGYKLTSFSKNNNEWLLVLTKTKAILDQCIVKRDYFPENDIKDLWDKGMIVSRLKFIDGYWYLLMSRYSTPLYQEWHTNDKLSEEEVSRLLNQNLRITAFSFGYYSKIQHLGINNDKMSTVFSPQKNSNWCWAANVQMIFNYFGFPKDQQSIVRSVYDSDKDGVLPDYRASDGQITQLLKMSNTDNNGNVCSIVPNYNGGFPDDSVIVSNLNLQCPIVFAYYNVPKIGHVCLLTGINYVIDIKGKMEILDLVLADPEVKENNGRVVWRKNVLFEKKKCFWTVKLDKKVQPKQTIQVSSAELMD